jgi:hypothetical protein
MLTLARLKEILKESQEHTSADTSIPQVSAGIKHAVKTGLIHPNSINVDNGGGRFDKGKEHVESSVEGAKLHVHDPYNRSEEHNSEVKKKTLGKSNYVGLHNVLNVIKEPESRIEALKQTKEFMHPKNGIAHITVYEGDKSGKGRVTKANKGRGSSWQNNRTTSSYADEVKKVFPDSTHHVSVKSGHIIVKPKID